MKYGVLATCLDAACDQAVAVIHNKTKTTLVRVMHL